MGHTRTENPVNIGTSWTTLLATQVDRTPGQISFGVYENTGNSKGSHVKIQYSHDNARWYDSLNSTFTSYLKGADTSVLYTSVDVTNDQYVQLPFIRIQAKKVTTAESMNATAYWADR